MNDIQNMIKEQTMCFRNPDGYQFECSQAVLEKYIRKNKLIGDLIYPWSNFNWDYSVIIEKKYKPEILGVSNSGSIEALTKDIDALIKIVEAFLITPNPSDNSGAGNPNKIDNDLVPCSVKNNQINQLKLIKEQINILQNIINQNKILFLDNIYKNQLVMLIARTQDFLKSCVVLNNLKIESSKQKKPYDDAFFKRNMDGENSSSFYVKYGSCPSKINNKEECEKNGYTWMENPLFKSKNKGVNTKNGSCFKGKYAFIENTPGLSIGNIKSAKGLIPSLLKNLTELSPDKFAFIAQGYGIPGLKIQKCEESFINYNKTELDTNNFIFIWILILILIGIVYFFLNSSI